MRTPFVGGNWKMNTDRASGVALARAVAEAAAGCKGVEIAVFPPFPYLGAIADALHGSRISLGAQDLYYEKSGAFTGEVSAAMLLDCGASAVLTGHSERRHVLGESDDLVNRKTRAALDAGLTCVLCIGETLDQRERGETHAVNERQLHAALAGVRPEQTQMLVIAYEPVWAIGTGRNATPADAQDAHARVRAVLASVFSPQAAAAMRIIYGGSLKPDNAEALLARPDVDGGLVGGASLSATDFCAIVRATEARVARPIA
ncbi:MAG TPA: triose-phosphate isomerase [Phycisphaerales bacterium]|nr:triose-phosphate isomerase [Phycisphaerales bacterium]